MSKATTKVAEELERIYDQRGELTPAIVVEEARDPGSVLHGYLEWSDPEAAARHRLDQAAALIRSVRVVYKDTPDGPKDLRAWVNVRPEDGRGGQYRPVQEVVTDDFTKALVLRQMEREWRSMQRRYEAFAEFSELVLKDLRGEAN